MWSPWSSFSLPLTLNFVTEFPSLHLRVKVRILDARQESWDVEIRCRHTYHLYHAVRSRLDCNKLLSNFSTITFSSVAVVFSSLLSNLKFFGLDTSTTGRNKTLHTVARQKWIILPPSGAFQDLNPWRLQKIRLFFAMLRTIFWILSFFTRCSLLELPHHLPASQFSALILCLLFYSCFSCS